jgi:hypothetical protein
MRILRGVVLGVAAGGLLVVGVAVVARFHDGPLGPFPGGKLSGTPVPDPSPDWSAALAGISHLELEVNPAMPRSVTTSFVVHDGVLYVPSLFAARKKWPREALADSRVVVRAGGKLYPRRAIRVTDPAELRTVMRAFDPKADPNADLGALTTWYFRLDPPSA